LDEPKVFVGKQELLCPGGCVKYQVNIIPGDGIKACNWHSQSREACQHTPQHFFQFWMDRMIHTATQSRLKNDMKGVAQVHEKHSISCSYKGLMFLQQNLRNITTQTCAGESAKKSEGDEIVALCQCVTGGMQGWTWRSTPITSTIKTTWIMWENFSFQ